MLNNEDKKLVEKPRFQLCQQCGQKGLYHIKQQYFRCRYCGIYIISPAFK
jgi:hypothetical protein